MQLLHVCRSNRLRNHISEEWNWASFHIFDSFAYLSFHCFWLFAYATFSLFFSQLWGICAWRCHTCFNSLILGCTIWHMFITNSGPWTLESVELDKRPDWESRQGFTGTHVAVGGNANKWEVPCPKQRELVPYLCLGEAQISGPGWEGA